MEVSPVPSPFPGTNSRTPGFEDHFLYPNGDLFGNGGWVVDELADPSPVIVGHQVTSPTDGEYSAAQPGAFDGLTWNSSWYLEVGVIYHTIALNDNNVQIWWGDITANAIALFLNGNTAIGSGHNVQVQIYDVDGTTSSVDITLGTLTAEHVFALRRSGPNLIASVDGVDVLTAAAAVGPPPTNNNLVLYFNNAPTATPANVTYVETGL